MRQALVRGLCAGALTMAVAIAGCSDDCGDAGPRLQGSVQSGADGGAQPIAGATVRLFEATDGAPRLLATATSGQSGGFALARPAVDGVSYVTATIGDGIELVAVLGESPPDAFIVNELTTVAAAFAFAQLYADGALRGEPLGLSIAAGMSANLADVGGGGPSAVLLASPNADQTNTLRSTRNLANLLAACVRGPSERCEALFAQTTPRGGVAPGDTMQAMVNLARNPAVNVRALYDQSATLTVYTPTLQAAPDAWTLAVKVNDTGSAERTFGGTANTVFDDRGYAWINNNSVQGTSVSSLHITVLKPDGSPADGADGTPRSPITGGGLLGAGFGISRNMDDGSIWVGNFGWGGVNPGPGGTGDGSVSQFAPDGTPISPADGYDGGTDRAQGVVVDRDGNVWIANYGNDKLVVFLDGDPERTASADLPCHPFGIAIAADGSAWVTTVGAGGIFNNEQDCETNATVSHWQLADGALQQLSLTEVGAQNKGLDVDFDGFVWVASGGDDTVYRLAPDGTVVGTYQGGGINAPWAVRIDDAGDVWVANFGRMAVVPPDNIYDTASLSVLAGPSSPSGLAVGQPISPPTGYTLPSAGEPVLLFDGTPLSETGNGEQPAFTPLMRSASAVPDRAGNVWVSNNWKPNFTQDLINDPGGDGMVIFVGLAEPTEPGRTQ